ncbi:hypothetical protein AYJ54_32275 [Bradyrhizobium centrolobii]|uniref:HTH cro/C1-type domain-containing protein n=1 Tax=Bradyrhizobium centrolobii TaxID=1505087 RepID=A0A176Y9Q6_9BRAD|nr:hypothetical protein [Bradyrhizobium centrolobii]OAE99957.1 hypothetical protein AYJ54_32275 [Bradyrhizobium centrolobii]
MAEAKLSARAKRIVAAGKLAYGETRWQSPLARAAGLSPALLQKIADGSRSVTDEVEDQIVAALLDEVARLERAALKLSALIGRILAAREK